MKLIALCCLVALLLGGCNPASEVDTSSVDKDPPAPAGLTYAKDIPGGLTVGTQIYYSNGVLAGTIQKIEPNHTFRNGKTTTGILFYKPGDSQMHWMNESAVGRGFFVKSQSQ